MQLDESLVVPQGIVDLLVATLDQWPQWLRVVATTRTYPNVLRSLYGMQAEVLRADAAENRADLEDYVAGRLKLSSTSSGNLVYKGVLDAAQGNFLIAKALLDEIREGDLGVEELLSVKLGRGSPLLPPALQSYYERSFARFFSPDSDFAPASSVLALAMAAIEPLDLLTLQAASGLEQSALASVLKKLAGFLPQRSDKRFAFFHKSVRDWLDAETVDSDFGEPIAGRFAINVRFGRTALADCVWTEYERGVQNASPYCLRHIIAHLHEAERNDQARTGAPWISTICKPNFSPRIRTN